MLKRTIIQVLFFVCVVLFLVQCRAAPEPALGEAPGEVPKPAALQAGPSAGIHVGIITFGPDAEDITGGMPVLLDRQGYGIAQLNSLLDSKFRREISGGTALFYAVHKALANMTKAQEHLPNLDHAIILTFTDGLDVSSTALTLPPISDPGNVHGLRFAGEDLRLYEEFVKQEIDSRVINGARINAYVASVRGDDITNIHAFETALFSLASTGENSRGVPFVLPPANEMAGLITMFEKIANTLVDAWTEQTFTMMTPQFPRGTRVRMTFAGETTAQQAQNAQMYVEGEVAVQNNAYYLVNIRYGGGISSNAGDQIRGVIEGNMVSYVFPLFTGYDLTRGQANITADVRQWIMNPGETVWQINTEYEPRPDAMAYDIRSNALVYLVLDRSTSIQPADFPKVREAAKLFIAMLHYAYHSHN